MACRWLVREESIFTAPDGPGPPSPDVRAPLIAVLTQARETGDIGTMRARPTPPRFRPLGQTSLCLALCGISTLASAQGKDKDLDRPPTLSSMPDGALELRSGPAVLARLAPTTPLLRRGTPQVRALQVDGHRVVEVRIPVRGRPAEDVWIGDVGTKPVRVIWQGLAGPRDADDETAIAVEATPERIYEYQTAGHVTRCDGEAVRLFTRAWDFATARFRPVLATAPDPAGQRLIARRGDPAMPAARPLGGFHFTAASTTLAAGADARALAAPAGLDDGDPKTVWAEGLGGDGRGEFLTARASAGRYRVQGLRIIPGDASTPASFKARNRLKVLTLAFGPEPERRFEVEFPEDPAAGPDKSRQPYWIALPAPVDSACLTVTIRAVYRGSEAAPAGGGGTTAISDLEIFTELDQPAGAERLIADIAGGAECRARVPLLVALGEAAVLPTAQSVLTSTGAGRECLVDALSRIEATTTSGVALDALAAALVGASAEEERLILGTFQRAQQRAGTKPGSVGAPVPIRALADLLASAKAQPEDRGRAARVLGALDDPEAARVLLAAAGSEPASLRLAIVQALGTTRQLTVAAVVTAIDAARAAGGAPGERREADLVRALPALARRTPGDRPATVASLRRALAVSKSFAVRGRAILALGSTGDPSVVPDLAAVRETSDDAVLRFLAARELATVGGAAALSALREALRDKDPRVREAAAQGLAQHKDRAAEEELIRAAKDEPWPFARRAQIEALARTCGAAGRDLLTRAMERDVDEVRRAAIVGVVRCKDRRARTIVLTILKARKASATLRELAGSLTGELDGARRDPTLARDVADILGGLVNEAEADLAIEGVAVSTLRALGTLRGPDAARAAATLARDTRHPYGQVALEALGEICDPGVGAKTLAEVRAGTDARLAAAAHTAEKRCAESAGGGAAPSRAP
jgi:HEAT repeat protein